MKRSGSVVPLDRMVRILRDRGPMRAGDLGAEMWLRVEQRYNDDAGRRHCRAAGKMLRRAKALGLVRDEQRGVNHLWFANSAICLKPNADGIREGAV